MSAEIPEEPSREPHTENFIKSKKEKKEEYAQDLDCQPAKTIDKCPSSIEQLLRNNIDFQLLSHSLLIARLRVHF